MAATRRGQTNRCVAQARALLALEVGSEALTEGAVLHAAHLLLRSAYQLLLAEIAETYHLQASPQTLAEAVDSLAAQGVTAQELQLLAENETPGSTLAVLLDDWRDARQARANTLRADLINAVQVDENNKNYDLAWYRAAVREMQQLITEVRDMGQQW